MTQSAIGKLNCFIFLCAYALMPSYAIAENDRPSNSFQEEIIINEDFVTDDIEENIVDDYELSPDLEKPFFSFLDTPQDMISSGVEVFAKNIDEFFSDDKVFYEASGSFLRLRVDSIINENGVRTYDGNIRLKLRLPNTKKKLKFTLESDANERPDDKVVSAENTPITAIEDKEYFAGVQATIGKENAWQFKPSIGLRLGSTVEPYVRFRFKRTYDFGEWYVNWNETPYWFDSFGWGFDSYLELNTKITNNDLFRVSTFARWTNEIDEFELSHTFSMYHTLSKRRAISYSAGVYGKSEPTTHATHYLLGLSYRQNIHKDYLFLELLPQVRYEKINDFHAEHSIILRIEMVFKK